MKKTANMATIIAKLRRARVPQSVKNQAADMLVELMGRATRAEGSKANLLRYGIPGALGLGGAGLGAGYALGSSKGAGAKDRLIKRAAAGGFLKKLLGMPMVDIGSAVRGVGGRLGRAGRGIERRLSGTGLKGLGSDIGRMGGAAEKSLRGTGRGLIRRGRVMQMSPKLQEELAALQRIAQRGKGSMSPMWTQEMGRLSQSAKPRARSQLAEMRKFLNAQRKAGRIPGSSTMKPSEYADLLDRLANR